jgi:hypothetical protein
MMSQFVKAKLVFAVLTASASLALPAQARAAFALDFSNIAGASLNFDGLGDFSFSNSSLSGPGKGFGFQITNVQPGTVGDSLGDYGTIGGAYAIGTVTQTNATREDATVTVTTPGKLTISDGTNTLSGNIAFLSIFTDSSGGGTGGKADGGGQVNLTNVTYSGSQQDLSFLKSAGSGFVSLTFNFNTAYDLNYLKSHATPDAYSGEITATPAPPGLWLLGIGAAVLGAGRFLRRRTSFLQAA